MHPEARQFVSVKRTLLRGRPGAGRAGPEEGARAPRQWGDDGSAGLRAGGGAGGPRGPEGPLRAGERMCAASEANSLFMTLVPDQKGVPEPAAPLLAVRRRPPYGPRRREARGAAGPLRPPGRH